VVKFPMPAEAKHLNHLLLEASARKQKYLIPQSIEKAIKTDYITLLEMRNSQEFTLIEKTWRDSLMRVLGDYLQTKPKSREHLWVETVLRSYIGAVGNPEEATLFFYNLLLCAFEKGEPAIEFVTKILRFDTETKSFLTPQSPATAYMFLAVYSQNVDTMRRFHVLDDMLTYYGSIAHRISPISNTVGKQIEEAHQSPTYRKVLRQLNPDLVKKRDHLSIQHGEVNLSKPIIGEQAYLLKPDPLRRAVVRWINYKYYEPTQSHLRLIAVVFPDGTERLYKGKSEELKALV